MRLTNKGYFLITVRKTVTLHLWSEDKESLLQEVKENPKKKYQVVEHVEDLETGIQYIIVNGQRIQVN